MSLSHINDRREPDPAKRLFAASRYLKTAETTRGEGSSIDLLSLLSAFRRSDEIISGKDCLLLWGVDQAQGGHCEY